MTNLADKKILIIGCSGLVGSTLFKMIPHSVGAYNKEPIRGNCIKMDITNMEDVNKIIQSFRPDIIIHTAALTDVDYCEDKREEAYNVNVEGTKNIVEAAKSVNAKVAYISTDYVFDGTNGPYSEDDETNPLGYYAKTKLEGENLVKTSGLPYIIIRTTVVYGVEDKKLNFALWLLKQLESGRKVNIANDQYSSPTLSTDLARTIIRLLENGKTGLYNVSGSEVVNRYDFALRIAEAFNLEKDLITPISTKELNQKAPRPMKAGLKVDKITKELGISPQTILEALKEFKAEVDYAK